mgnify:CR=1 FL=1
MSKCGSVAIIGRPSVGKSTLVNFTIEEFEAYTAPPNVLA